MSRPRCLGLIACWSLLAATPCLAQDDAGPGAWHSEREVFYKIFVRSFADSNGDRIGDLAGIERRLPYLQALGVTSLVLTPIVPSFYYHNYFASRFDAVDPAYGTQAAFRHLVTSLHRRGMKIYLDEEIQYVAEDHPWWLESAGHPESRYSQYLLYNGPGNTAAESGFLGNLTVTTYDGRPVHLAMVNLRSPAVQSYFESVLAGWVDPFGNQQFTAGVDGFRIDHMMDDLDKRGRLPNLLAGFWAPQFAKLRALNPALTIIAEQADWGFGDDLLQRGDVDLVYAFPLRAAIVSLNRDAVAKAIEDTAARTPAGKGQLIFIENHDTNRFASEVNGDPAKERLAAALNVLLKGAPLLYYGQELGMRGKRRDGGLSDGNDIPDREAFRWDATLGSPGTATWYRNSGPWWNERYSRDHDGISVAEQLRDPGSLLRYYQRLLALRRERFELREGDQHVIATDQPAVLAVTRSRARRTTLLLANFSAQAVTVSAPLEGGGLHDGQTLPDLIGNHAAARVDGGKVVATLPAYGVVLVSPPQDLPQPASGKIDRLPAFPSRYVAARNVDVWLPPGYSATKRYAVLYMQDGQMLFDARTTWNKQAWNVDAALTRLAAAGRISDAIVVGIWNSGATRHSEYFPEKSLPFVAEPLRTRFTKEALTGVPLADRYLRFLVEELKPAIDARYATRPGRESTFLMGSSMGGMISLYAMSEYPEIFGGAACLSTHWPGTLCANASLPLAAFNYLQAHLPDPATHRVYMDHGTKDLDALYGTDQAFVDELVRERGYTDANWQTRVFEGAGHNEHDWAARLDEPLLFLLGKR